MSRIIAILFSVVMFSVFGDTWTDPKTGITWTYTIAEGKASIGGGTRLSTAISAENTGVIKIPATLGGCPVTNIDKFAFYCCTGLTSIRMPSSVTNISVNSFYGCSGLTAITIPGSVESIDKLAFDQCRELKTVRVTGSKDIEHVRELLVAAEVDLTNVTIEIAPPRAPSITVH